MRGGSDGTLRTKVSSRLFSELDDVACSLNVRDHNVRTMLSRHWALLRHGVCLRHSFCPRRCGYAKQANDGSGRLEHLGGDDMRFATRVERRERVTGATEDLKHEEEWLHQVLRGTSTSKGLYDRRTSCTAFVTYLSCPIRYTPKLDWRHGNGERHKSSLPSQSHLLRSPSCDQSAKTWVSTFRSSNTGSDYNWVDKTMCLRNECEG